MSIINLSFCKNVKEHGKAKTTMLVYLLEGSAKLKLSQHSYDMEKHDVIAINKKEEYSIDGESCLLAKFELNEREYLKLISIKAIDLKCNTINNQKDDFSKLRQILKSIIDTSFEENYEKIYYEKYTYELLILLFTNYMEYSVDEKIDSRKEQIENYIYMNFQNNISLEDISSYFGLTPQYFSKYFKETFEVPFLKYLNRLRLERACDDLLMTDHTIIKIALDNGFPNVTSFTKAFIKKYREKPSEYRKKQYQETISQNILNKKEIRSLLQSQDTIIEDNCHEIETSTDKKQVLKPYWTKVCNLGTITALLNGDLRNQFQVLKEQLGFECARIKLDRKIRQTDQQFDFYEEEKVFDYLVALGFKPILVIDFRDYYRKEKFLKYLKVLMIHCFNRYGRNNVYHWKLELFYNTIFTKEKAMEFCRFRKQINEILSDLKLKYMISGPGAVVHGESLRQFLKYNKDIETFTISIAPFSLNTKDEDIFVHRITDSNYIFHQYHEAVTIGNEFGISDIQIASWKNILVEHHDINDSCYRAANILKNILQGYEYLPSLPIDYPLDMMYQYNGRNGIMSGLPGLLTRKDVKKPSFYIYKFLNQLDPYFLYKDNFCIITNNENNYFEIVCHNCKNLNYKFYYNEEKNRTDKKMSSYFEDLDDICLHFTIHGIDEGNYFIKSRYVNKEHGSALSEWEKMNFKEESFFGPDEIQYLKALSQPSINGMQMQSQNGMLDFTVRLQANEIRHLHIIKEN